MLEHLNCGVGIPALAYDVVFEKAPGRTTERRGLKTLVPPKLLQW